MQPQLPPGPRAPSIVQTVGWWARTPIVVLSDPEDRREAFTAPPEVLHPGAGAGLSAALTEERRREGTSDGGRADGRDGEARRRRAQHTVVLHHRVAAPSAGRVGAAA